ncbi:MAG TPA: MFS transporter, partial [Mycobacterium sp.]|nr:MFS transporter [Mycobacterium sp.]
TRLINPAGVHFRPFLCALGTSVAAGAALMVTLVDVELFAQGVLGKDQDEAALVLLWFLAALPVGAVTGGWIATKIGDRAMTSIGLLIAAGAYWLISGWRPDLPSHHHHILGLVTLPAMDTDLALAGVGLGLVIGPLSSASLRVVPSAQHGIAAALVVVARMTGMLVGIAALSAWGFQRFNQIVAAKTAAIPSNASLAERLLIKGELYRQSFAEMYGGIFTVTAVVCVVGALLGLLLSSRRVHAEEPQAAEPQVVGPKA